MKKKWEMEIVMLDSERYVELQELEWEPFHFVMIPVPPDQQHSGLIQANGGGPSSAFVQMVGMRHLGAVDNLSGIKQGGDRRTSS